VAEPFSESWFYAPGLESPGDAFPLPEEEAHHLRKVLRLKPGDSVIASNGRGRVFACAVRGSDTRVSDAGILLAAESLLAQEPEPPRLNFLLGLLKGRDLEEPVEGICQLAVHRIFLAETDHCQTFKGQDHSRMLERLRAKSLVGLKQAKKAWLTAIHAPAALRVWRAANPDLPLVIAAPGEDTGLPRAGTAFALAVGPEGGFSAAEAAWFREQGCGNLSLGKTRIRGTHAPLLAAGKLMGLGLA
jgi:16S rRNA (uracil1498-N3)-methyltransferase